LGTTTTIYENAVTCRVFTATAAYSTSTDTTATYAITTYSTTTGAATNYATAADATTAGNANHAVSIAIRVDHATATTSTNSVTATNTAYDAVAYRASIKRFYPCTTYTAKTGFFTRDNLCNNAPRGTLKNTPGDTPSFSAA